MCKNKRENCYYMTGELCLDEPCHEREIAMLKQEWYTDTQFPLSRDVFIDEESWKMYRSQLTLADEIIYYDSSKQTNIGEKE